MPTRLRSAWPVATSSRHSRSTARAAPLRSRRFAEAARVRRSRSPRGRSKTTRAAAPLARPAQKQTRWSATQTLRSTTRRQCKCCKHRHRHRHGRSMLLRVFRRDRRGDRRSNRLDHRSFPLRHRHRHRHHDPHQPPQRSCRGGAPNRQAALGLRLRLRRPTPPAAPAHRAGPAHGPPCWLRQSPETGLPTAANPATRGAWKATCDEVKPCR
jgi:hypothetical protein